MLTTNDLGAPVAPLGLRNTVKSRGALKMFVCLTYNPHDVQPS